MAWIKIDDGFFRHPKAIKAGKDGRILFIASICYAGSNLTDGFVPDGALAFLAAETGIGKPKEVAKGLVDAGLWEVCDGGYLVHDYLDYNSSSQRVRDERSAARERMQRKRSADVRPNISKSSSEVRRSDTDIETTSSLEPNGSEELDTPLPPKGERARSSKSVDLTGFDDWYQLYPRHVGRTPAEAEWAKLKPDDRAAALAALKEQLTWPAFAEAPPDKIPHPTTWLHQRRWTDEPGQSTTTNGNGRSPTPPRLPTVLQPGKVPADGGLSAYLAKKGITDASTPNGRTAGGPAGR